MRVIQWLVWMVLLSACSPSKFACPVTAGPTAETYAVEKACYRGMVDRIEACYAEAR